MVVDDDPAVRLLVTLSLRRAGYTVEDSVSRYACLDWLRSGFKGLILMDMLMPGFDG